MTKRILQDIALDKIACVDRPCQEHALVAIMKREDDSTPQIADPSLVKIADAIASDLAKGNGTTLRLILKQMDQDAMLLVPALKYSLVTIMSEPEGLRKSMMANSVQQFLEVVNKTGGADHLLQVLAAHRLHGKLSMLKRLLHPVAKRERPVPQRVPLQVDKQVFTATRLKKEWTDQARAAAAAARKHRTKAGSFPEQYKGEGGMHHSVASAYERAAKHFSAGDPVSAMRGHNQIRRADDMINHMHEWGYKNFPRFFRKQGYYVRLKNSQDGSVKHFNCEAGNRQGARGQAMRAHEGCDVVHLHEKPHYVSKAWSDEARAAAAEARRRRHSTMESWHGAQDGGVRIGHPHSQASSAHSWATTFYGEAADAYRRGDRKKGKMFARQARRQGREANRMTNNLRSPAARAGRLAGRGLAGIAGAYGIGVIDRWLTDRNRDKSVAKIKPGQMRRKPSPRLKDLHQNSGLAPYFNSSGSHQTAPPLPMGFLNRLGKRKLMPKGEFMSKMGKQDILVRLFGPIEFGKKLPANASVKDYIDDFVNSDNPRFEGKSKKERIRMALGAYYSNR